MKKAEYLKQLVKEKDVKISQILKDHWAEFKRTKLYKVPEDMRKSVVEAVEKALSCGDIKKGIQNSNVLNVTVGMRLS